MLSDKQELVHHPPSLSVQQKQRSVLRIFVIFFHPSASVTAMGGAEKRFVETLKFFCRRKDLEITVIESAPTLLTRTGITCKKHLSASLFQRKGWLGNYLGWILWAARVSMKSLSLMHNANVDAVLVPNNTLPNLLSGYAASSILHLPLYVVVHHVDTPFLKGKETEASLFSSYRNIKYSRAVSFTKTLASSIMLFILKKVEGIIAVSNFTADTLKNSGVRHDRINVSGNAIDNTLINNIKPYATEKIYDGVFVGRIAKEKGVFDLLKAWKRVVESKPNARLLIIGSGLELADVKKNIIASNLESNVIIRGKCDETELYSLLKSSRVFIFSSRLEGWGIAVAEALACGLPVIAYDIPALREIFGRCNSVFLVPIGDVSRIAQTALEVLRMDNMAFQRISIEYAENFDWNKVALADLEAITNFIKVS